MSYTNLIKNTLDILDLNITFNENSLKKERIKGRICHVFSGTLDYFAHSCHHCGAKENGSIILWSFTTCLILLNDVSEYQTYLRLKKRRFFCHSCDRTFVAETSLIEKCCSISKKVKLSIAERLRNTSSMSEIARQKKVSVSSVYRVLKQFYEPKKINRLILPEVLCFDEFKSVKQVAASMSFIMMDGQTKQLLDVVENRQLPFLERYFSRFSLSVREGVKYIVCDMYAPYFSLIKKLFPKAQIVLDRFHIVQHIGRTFLKHRIQRMNTFLHQGSVEAKKYRHLKKYWKLLQKNQSKLNFEKRQWRPSFRAYLTETELVDRLLAYDEELKAGYTCYQDFLYAIQTRDFTRFHALLEQDYSRLPAYYQTTITTFKKVQTGIKNALDLPYSNGPLECLNNPIKVLKRNAYGFRNFYNFKGSILSDVGEKSLASFLMQNNRKDTLISFRIKSTKTNQKEEIKMSYTNLIKNTLDILDLNITFNENSLKKERIKGRICHVFSGTLDYFAHSCHHCGAKENGSIILWSFTTCLILLNDVSEVQTYLRLKKRRFFCHSCDRTFVAETSLIEKCCSISKKVKLSIAERLRNTSKWHFANTVFWIHFFIESNLNNSLNDKTLLSYPIETLHFMTNNQ